MPNGYAYDNRYQEIGFAVNENTLRDENGINQIYEYFRQ